MLLKLKKEEHFAYIAAFLTFVSALIRVYAGYLTSSLAITAEGFHALTDVVLSFVAAIACIGARKPADRTHPYGHGRIEDLFVLLEALVLLTLAGFILFEAITRINKPTFKMDPISMAFYAFTLILVLLGSLFEKYGAKIFDSNVLRADSIHLMADVFVGFAVLIGLLVEEVFSLHFLDAFMSILIALWILKTSLSLGFRSISSIMETRVVEVESYLKSQCTNIPGLLSVHAIRTRKSGNGVYLDLHLVFPACFTLYQANKCAEKLVSCLKRRFENLDIVFRLDACVENGSDCNKNCKRYNEMCMLKKNLDKNNKCPLTK
ncbi:cation diffusion facilitator family transporter [Thermodesulfobium narugense DSM 14796]|uniref:Cation diffusion facilitator family transporter n=1 Tax=Thermodesulfobium narugense DSM 14796 TaxID=747365 RepID=M1E485_9BACT|nr:cation diffusion facilitator family transporter [Thermodesulfobium narugense DSM 14796]